MTLLSSILFIVYLAVLIIMGLKMSKGLDSMESYWMANRSLPGWRIGFCLAASWFGLSSFTGQAGWLYNEGLGALFYLAIPNFAAIFLIGVVFVKRIRKIPAISQPEFLEMRYSVALRPWLAIIILVAFAGYSAMEFIALEYVFEVFMGWPGWLGALIIVVVTLLYVNLGGMNTVVWTEVIQYGLLFLVGAVVGIGALIKGSAMISAGEVAGIAAGTSIFAVPTLETGSWWNILSVGLGATVILIVGMWPGWATEQSPWQRIWMAKDTKNAFKGAMWGTGMNAVVYMFSIFMAVGAWVIIGSPAAQATDFNPELIVYLLMQEILPGWLISILLVGFLAAAMSNISNFATSSASSLAKDWYQRYLRPHASQKEMVWASRICIFVTLALGVFMGMVMPSILDAVFAAASLATCGYVVPIVGALYWRRGNTPGALTALILGGGSYIVLYIGANYLGWAVPYDPVVIGLVLSIVSYIVVSLLTPAPKTTQLLGFFEQDAAKYISEWKAAGVKDEASTESISYVNSNIKVIPEGERTLLQVKYDVQGGDFSTIEKWEAYINKLLKNTSWAWLSGYDVLYKINLVDMLGNVRLARGIGDVGVMLYCEPLNEEVEAAKKNIAIAIDDLTLALAK